MLVSTAWLDRAAEMSNTLHGKGGYPITWLFAGMAHHRLGRREQALTSITRYETWLKDQKFHTWWQEVFWRKLQRRVR